MPTRSLALLVIVTTVVVLAFSAFGAPPSGPPGTESYNGFDIARMAEATARLTTFRTQHGEAKGNQVFADWLSGQGLTDAGYREAWNLWWERFRADPTGQLEARFHRINSEWVQQLNYGDVKDRRQEKKEGVSLDTYAQIAVALTRMPGAKLDDVLKKHGVKGTAQWQKASEAWGKAMREDGALVQQYAALYQKYAGPQYAAERDAVVANAAAQTGNHPAATPAAKAAPETLEQVVARMNASQGRDRMDAAREYAHACDLWSGPARKDPKDPRAPLCTPDVLKKDLVPVILESLDRADDRTLGYAVNLLRYMESLKLKEERQKLTLTRVRNRAKDRLDTLEKSFAPIQDKAVPERVLLRQKIDDTASALADLESALAKW
ncbi:MAG: hypothetical protein JNK60_05240 [Acidobacteria bacterium]|nr:hypothetical protein [Acidobacteriota bacterium]